MDAPLQQRQQQKDGDPESVLDSEEEALDEIEEALEIEESYIETVEEQLEIGRQPIIQSVETNEMDTSFDDEIDHWTKGQLEGHVLHQINVIREMQRRAKLRNVVARKVRGVIVSATPIAVAGALTLATGYVMMPVFGQAAVANALVRVFFVYHTAVTKDAKMAARAGATQVAGTVVSSTLSSFGFAGVFAGFIFAPIASNMTGAVVDVTLRIDPSHVSQDFQREDAVEKELEEIRRIKQHKKTSFEDAMAIRDRAILPSDAPKKLAVSIAAAAFGNALASRTFMAETASPVVTGMVMQYLEVGKVVDRLTARGLLLAGIDEDVKLGDVLKLPKAVRDHWLGRYLYEQSIRQALSTAISVQATRSFGDLMAGLTPENAYKFGKALQASAVTTLDRVQTMQEWMTSTPVPDASEIRVEEPPVPSRLEEEIMIPDQAPALPVIDEALVERLKTTQADLMAESDRLRSLMDDVEHGIRLRENAGYGNLDGARKMTERIRAAVSDVDESLRRVTAAKQRAQTGDMDGAPIPADVAGKQAASIAAAIQESLSMANAEFSTSMKDALPFLKTLVDPEKGGELTRALTATMTREQLENVRALVSTLEKAGPGPASDAALIAAADVKTRLDARPREIVSGDPTKEAACALQPFNPACVSARADTMRAALEMERGAWSAFSKEANDAKALAEAKSRLVSSATNATEKDMSEAFLAAENSLRSIEERLSKVEETARQTTDAKIDTTSSAIEELRARMAQIQNDLDAKIAETYSSSTAFMSVLAEKTVLGEKQSAALSEVARILATSEGSSLNTMERVDALRAFVDHVKGAVGESDALCVFDPSRPECTVEAALGKLADYGLHGAVGLGGMAFSSIGGAGFLVSSMMGSLSSFGFKRLTPSYDRTFNKGRFYQTMMTSSFERSKDIIQLVQQSLTTTTDASSVQKTLAITGRLVALATKAGALEGVFGRGIRFQAKQ